MERYTKEELWKFRNEISMLSVCESLLKLPVKSIEGVNRFQCPLCYEMRTSINPKTNLGRCFRCARNFNPIEIVMVAQDKGFLEAVRCLEGYVRCSAPPCTKLH